MADNRIGVAAKSGLMRRVTGGCDDTLELYLEKYIVEDQGVGRREEINDEETKRAGSTSLLQCRSLYREVSRGKVPLCFPILGEER